MACPLWWVPAAVARPLCQLQESWCPPAPRQVDPAGLEPLAFASHTYPTFHLLMPLYACYHWRGTPRGEEGQQVAWASADDLHAYDLTAGDVPLVPAVLRALRGAAPSAAGGARG